MISTSYNPAAKTPVEHFANCQFQMANIEGWLLHANNPQCALIKAECLREELDQLITTLAAQTKQEAA